MRRLLTVFVAAIACIAVVAAVLFLGNGSLEVTRVADTNEEGAGAREEHEELAAQDTLAAAPRDIRIPDWNLPNGRFHHVLLLDVSGSLSKYDVVEAAKITTARIRSVTGRNKVTVYLVHASYVRWPTAASDSGRSRLADEVYKYMNTHHFTRTERSYTNYALPLANAMQDGFFELKEHGTRFHATVVGDGWDEGPPGRDSAFLRASMRSLVSRIPAERANMFAVDLIAVNARDNDPRYPREEHLRSIFADDSFPVYPAAKWSDVAARFQALDRELNGTYQWTNVHEPVEVRLGDIGEMRPAGVYAFSLDAPSKNAGEYFTARLIAASEHSNRIKHICAFWRIRGAGSLPVPITEGLVLPDRSEVEFFTSINPENPPPNPLVLGFSVLGEVELVPHSAVSLKPLGEKPRIQSVWPGWVFRNWIWDKLAGLGALALAALGIFVPLKRRYNRKYSMGEAGDMDTLLHGEVVAQVLCDGHVYDIRREWELVRNMYVIPAPDGIYLRPNILCTMIPLSGESTEKQDVSAGEMVRISASSVEIRDQANVVYQVAQTAQSGQRQGDAESSNTDNLFPIARSA